MPGIIVLCVRWYLGYKLSYDDLAKMIAERGVPVARAMSATLQHSRSAGIALHAKRRLVRVDETYVKIRGRWIYLLLVSRRGCRRSDGRLSPEPQARRGRRQTFFPKAFKSQGLVPHTIALDEFPCESAGAANSVKVLFLKCSVSRLQWQGEPLIWRREDLPKSTLTRSGSSSTIS
jgi:transposase-like protein